MRRHWIEHSSDALARLPTDRLVAVLPVGAVEQHGPHLPLSVDSRIVGALVDRLAKALPEQSHALFLPVQMIGKSNEHEEYPGTLTLRAETFLAVIRETAECVRSAGVRKLVVLNAHGGNSSLLDVAGREIRVATGMLVVNVNWWDVGLPPGLYAEQEVRHGIHAGEMETSVMLHLDPDQVDFAKAGNFRPRSADWESGFRHLRLSRGGRVAWRVRDLHPAGACGNAAAASPEAGRRTLDHAADALAELLMEVERMQPDDLSEARQ